MFSKKRDRKAADAMEAAYVQAMESFDRRWTLGSATRPATFPSGAAFEPDGLIAAVREVYGRAIRETESEDPDVMGCSMILAVISELGTSQPSIGFARGVWPRARACSGVVLLPMPTQLESWPNTSAGSGRSPVRSTNGSSPLTASARPSWVCSHNGRLAYGWLMGWLTGEHLVVRRWPGRCAAPAGGRGADHARGSESDRAGAEPSAQAGAR